MQVSAVNQSVSTFGREMHSGGGGLVTPALRKERKGRKARIEKKGMGERTRKEGKEGRSKEGKKEREKRKRQKVSKK